MFRAALPEAGLLKESVNVIASLITEGVFNLKKDGMELIAIDSANVAMVEFKLHQMAFETYEIDKEMSIGINFDDLKTVMKRAKKTNRIEIEVDKQLKITIGGRRSFYLPLLDIKQNVPNVPKLEFPAKAEVRASFLLDSIADAKQIADAAIFEATENEFKIRARGEGREVEAKLIRGDEDLISLEVESPAKSMFPIDYLEKMVKASKLVDTAVVKLGNDYPMRLEFSLIDRLDLSFILAPRIE